MFSKNRLEIWTITSLIIVTLFFVIGLYQSGLFFAPVQTYMMTAMILVGLITTIALKGWKLRMPAWLILAFTYAAYTLLTTLWAANGTLAVQGSVTIVASVLLALLGSTIPAWSKRYIIMLVSSCGAFLYIFALGTLFHWWNYVAAAVPDQNGNMQMNSIFQYHNTFGAFELTAFVLSLGLMDVARQWWERALYLICAVFCVLGVLSSYSREVWILLPVAIILLILVQSLRRRTGSTLLSLTYALVVSAAAAPSAITALSHGNLQMGLLTIALVITASVAITVLGVLFAHVLKRKVTRVVVIATLGLVSFAAVVVLSHHEANKLGLIASRLGSIQLKDFSVQQRILFYQAALHIWKTSPIFGSGWGTWTAKFLAFQQYPYQTTMAHSVVMDNLINGGLVGICLWIGTIVMAVVSAVRSIRSSKETSSIVAISVVAGLTMIIHGAFDFDFNFALITATFFLILGMSASGHSVYQNAGDRLSDVDYNATVKQTNRNVRWKYVCSPIANTLMGITACVALVAGATLSVAQHLYYKATVTDKSLSGFAELDLERAIKWAPYFADAHAQLAQQYYTNFTQSRSQMNEVAAWKQARVAAAEDPWNPKTQQAMSLMAYHFGVITQAYVWSQRAASDSPFHIEYPTTYMGIGLWTAVQQYKQNPQMNDERLQLVVDQLHVAQNNIRNQQHMTFGYHPDWSYEIGAAMQAYAGAADLALGNYRQSLKDMSGLTLHEPDPDTLGLYQLVTLLDEQRLHPGYNDPLIEQTVMSNPTLKAEYQDLEQIRPTN